MARKKREPEAKPAAGWITTFSDLMNLLLCFFVLLFSMSTVDAEKFQMVIASLQSSLSIMPAGSMSIGEGEMVGNGISQLPNIDVFLKRHQERMGIPRVAKQKRLRLRQM